MKIAVDFIGDESLAVGFAAVFGIVNVGAQGPNAQVVAGIDDELAVIGGAGIDVAHFLPGFALVLAAECAALGIFDQGINDVGILAVDGESDAAGIAFRQILGQFFPSGAAIRGFVNPAAGATAVVTVRSAAALIGCGVKSIGTLRIHGDIHDAGIIIDEKNAIPGFAAIGGFIEAALRIRSPQTAECRDVNHVWIRGMNHDAADVAGGVEAHLIPSLAAVSGFVNTVATKTNFGGCSARRYPPRRGAGSEGAMARSPIEEFSSLSKTGVNVTPPLVVFQTPPEAAPTKNVSGLFSTTAISSMRPPMMAGPISRSFNPDSAESMVGGGAGVLVAGGVDCSAGFASGCFSGARFFS